MNYVQDIDKCFAFFVNVALQSTVLLAIAIVVLALAHKISAARRHLIALSFLGAMLLLPLLDGTLPTRWSIAGWPARGAAKQRMDSWTSDVQPTPSSVSTQKPTDSIIISSSTHPDMPSNPGPILTGTAKSITSTTTGAGQFQSVLLVIWLVGAVLLLTRTAVTGVRLSLAARRCPAVDRELFPRLLTGIRGRIGEMAVVRVVESTSRWCTSVPVTWGIKRPMLLLPEAWTEWPEQTLKSALLHEMAHIRRRDWMVQMVTNAICALYWFHPLVWYLNRRMQIEAELACDDMVLMAGIPATEYASSLLEVVRRMKHRRDVALGAVAMAIRGDVSGRIRAVLHSDRPRKPIKRASLALALLAATALAVSTACLRPIAAQLQSTSGSHRVIVDVNKSIVDDQPGRYGPVVTLENGVNIELIGIGNDPFCPYTGGDDWWNREGTLLPEVPTLRTDSGFHSDHPITFSARVLQHALWFRLFSEKEQQVSTTGYFIDPTRHLAKDMYHFGRDVRIDDVKLSSGHPASGVVPVAMPAGDSRGTYRFGVATGPWETIGIARIPEEIHPLSAVTITLDGQLTAHFTTKQRKNISRPLLNSSTPLGDVARRVIALDKDGHEVDIGALFYHGAFEAKVDLSPKQLKRIVELQLQIRPYQWAEFKDIALSPHRPFPPITTPAPLPDYSHTLAGGYKMALVAVTEPRIEGGDWWRPDGKKYTGPLKDYMLDVDYRYIDAKTRRRTILGGKSGRIPTTFSEAWQLIPDPTSGYWHGIHREEQRNGEHPDTPFPWSIGVGYPANVHKITLRWGISTAPWKSVTNLPLPTDMKHHQATAKPYKYEQDLAISLGDHPSLSYETPSGEKRELPFLPGGHGVGDVAVRVVAIGSDNQIMQLDTNVVTNLGENQIWLSFRSDSPVHQQNPFNLARIKGFQLQTRPYEWAEFKHIHLDPAQ